MPGAASEGLWELFSPRGGEKLGLPDSRSPYRLSYAYW